MKKILGIIVIFLIYFLTACSPNEQNNGEGIYKEIFPYDVKLLLDNEESHIIVDVRTLEEYIDEHIPTAILIPNEEIGNTRPEQLNDLNITIIVYCRSGNRSEDAAKKLIELGYKDVRDLGGINEWPYKTVSGIEVGSWENTGEENKPVVSGIMSKFNAETIYGKKVNESILSEYKLTMVNVWATFCGPCISEMPELGKIAVEYKSKGVQIVGIVSDVFKSNGSIDESQIDTAKYIVELTKADYLHIVPSKDLYPVINISEYVPVTIFVDKDGNQVGELFVGAKNEAEWKKIIDKLLEEVSK